MTCFLGRNRGSSTITLSSSQESGEARRVIKKNFDSTACEDEEQPGDLCILAQRHVTLEYV